MNTVTVIDPFLVVEPKGFDKIWSFKRRIRIPLANVRGAIVAPDASRERKGLRAPGLGIPGKWAGTLKKGGAISYWNVSGRGGTIEIELANERYARLVLTVDDPRSVVDFVNVAIRAV